MLPLDSLHSDVDMGSLASVYSMLLSTYSMILRSMFVCMHVCSTACVFPVRSGVPVCAVAQRELSQQGDEK